LKVVLTKGKKVTQRTESLSDLLVAIAVLPESGPEKLLLIMWAFAVTEGSGLVHQCGKYGLFVGSLVAGVGIEIEVSVCELAIDSGPVSH
jgi:hypothetical protein